MPTPSSHPPFVPLFLAAVALPFASFAQEPSRKVTVPKEGTQVSINQVDTILYPKVTLYATVLLRGEPLSGLGASDFRVIEEEIEQAPLAVAAQRSPLKVALVLDNSGSMRKDLPQVVAAAKGFLATLQPEDAVQVTMFANAIRTAYPLGTNRRTAEAAINSSIARGGTALYDALHFSLEDLHREPGRRAIVILTDGKDETA